MNKSVFGKSREKLATTEKIRNYLVSKPNYYATKFFSEKYLAVDSGKKSIFMNKAFYLGLSILEISQIVMHKF